MGPWAQIGPMGRAQIGPRPMGPWARAGARARARGLLFFQKIACREVDLAKYGKNMFFCAFSQLRIEKLV